MTGTDAPPAGSRRRVILLVAALVVVGGLGAFGAWWTDPWRPGSTHPATLRVHDGFCTRPEGMRIVTKDPLPGATAWELVTGADGRAPTPPGEMLVPVAWLDAALEGVDGTLAILDDRHARFAAGGEERPVERAGPCEVFSE